MLKAIWGGREHWGGDATHCTFCPGYQVLDQRIVQIITTPTGLHPAGLFRELSDRLTLVLHDGVAAVELLGGPAIEADAVVVSSRFRVSSLPAT